VKLRAFPLLADQNVHADVGRFLREEGFDVVDVQQAGLGGANDADILAKAVAQGRAIVSHDADFGMLAIRAGAAYVGIVHLRPGHISPQVTIDSLRQLLALEIDVISPFIVTVKRSGGSITVRVRHGAP
jgi:predicted nuclease of predicted toxin-antitoxin system